MERWLRNVIELGGRLVFLQDGDPSVVEYHATKTELPTARSSRLPRCSPQDTGLCPEVIYRMLCALAAEERFNLHNLIIIKSGHVLLEISRTGYDIGMWCLSHSLSKTLVGAAIGMLCDDGSLSLDARICEIFPRLRVRDEALRTATVEHLLTMRSGVRFAEVGVVAENDWLAAFFSSSLSAKPGTRFAYNSMNSYVLGCIARKVGGMSLTELLRPRLLEPLGVGSFLWETYHKGREKGGLGAYMCLEDWCKVGMLYSGGGRWRGVQILSQKWVESSTGVKIPTPHDTGDYDYGYHIWLGRENDDILLSGMFGQNIWVCPRNDIIVGINAGNNELFQNSPGLRIIEQYLGAELPPVSNKYASRLVGIGERYFAHTTHGTPIKRRSILERMLNIGELPRGWERMCGTYDFSPNNHGVLPLFIRLMQNNYGGGIRSLSLESRGGVATATFTEEKMQLTLPIGFREPRRTVIDARGEKYIVLVKGSLTQYEAGRILLRLELSFPETPNTRTVELFLDGNGELRMELSEMPNRHALTSMLAELSHTNAVFAMIRRTLEHKLGEDLIERKLDEYFSPTLVGARRGAREYADILRREAERTAPDPRAAKIAELLIDKLGKKGFAIGDTFDSILCALRSRLPRLPHRGSKE